MEKSERKSDYFNPDDIKQLFEEVSPDTEEGEVIQNLLYESIKSFFDLGFELAKNLNLEFLYDQFKNVKTKKDKK